MAASHISMLLEEVMEMTKVGKEEGGPWRAAHCVHSGGGDGGWNEN